LKKNKRENSVLKLKKVSIRFDNRCYRFSKTTNALTPYWLTLSLNKRERIILPIAFGEKQRRRIESAYRGEWKFATVEMVKRNGEWYAHFVLSKTVELPDEPETVIAIDRGEAQLSRSSRHLKKRSRKAHERAALTRRGDQAPERSIQPHQKEATGEAQSLKD